MSSSLVPVNPQIREKFILSLILFVYQQLDKWRDYPSRSKECSEKRLNTNLERHLSQVARNNEMPFMFHHEEPQEGNRSVDLSAYPASGDYNETIIVFECKRLPAPTSDRADEYVTGHKEITGGIQRFKIEAHGKEHNIVGMIGYVQSETCSYHLRAINTCIDNLGGKLDENGLLWTDKEHLSKIECDSKTRKYYCKSIHSRINSKIIIHHLWVKMD